MALKKVIAVVGPTASGKTDFSIEIAKKYGGEIVSADSMQIYKQLSIGTARPLQEEMKGVEHHLLGYVDLSEHYSVADYVDDAKKEIDGIISKNKLPIICGGTGLYVDSLLSGTHFEEIKSDDSIRKKYYDYAEKNGNENLHKLLSEIDPEAAERIHFNNLIRVVRALEVYDITGRKISDLQRQSHDYGSEYDVLYLGINCRNRQLLYDRINKRVDLMIEKGLMDEVKLVYDNKDASTVRQAIGFKELFPYLEGKDSLSNCIDTLKKESRHYAKRQLTWFLRNESINWLYLDDYTDFNELFLDSVKIIEKWRKDEK